LGRLAVALQESARGAAHLRAALEQYERLGATAVARIARGELAALAATAPASSEFRFADGLWRFGFADRQAQLPDAKGLHDIAALLSAPGTEIHVFDLLGVEGSKLGADPVLDDIAKAQYKARLAELDQRLDVADASGDDALANRLTAERDALLAELRSAAGLAGRSRRLGDAGERARKAIGARVRDALGKIDRVHPELAAHLRESLRLGTNCSYLPARPIRWQLH
jgi:hypothetical protein